MTWTRLDDQWCDDPVLAEISHEGRWHYLALIQWCSRTKRYDGVLRLQDARRCSDVDNPTQAISELVKHGLVQQTGDNTLHVVRIDEHIPPPSVRENSERTKIRMRRSRAHKNGDHSLCLPEHCKQAPAVNGLHVQGESLENRNVMGKVTRNTRTGRDRTGQASYNQVSYESERTVTSWEVAPIPQGESDSGSAFCSAGGCSRNAVADGLCLHHQTEMVPIT